ncbi:hypothetical protein IVB03_39530 [Bradyrhizobium sp. 168]|uniref:hypothetical protein n=1 Tax=Bradyrhizobium sp. 168 TaxID=2782639 RepID=UPI001FF8008F|nr:hypothetical protein [Bradyrhizobium sp. 168]MCK1585488.1 hypothetical protein [Bradyrhizobium sp. 168]
MSGFSGPAQGQIPGTTTNDNATAGRIGEYVESVILVGSAVSVTSGASKTIASISLTAGDWDVDQVMYFVPAATTNVTQMLCSFSLTTNVIDTTPGRFNSLTLPAFVPGATSLAVALPAYRFSLSGSTTIFAIANATFTVSTMTSYTIIRARRPR